MRRTVRRPLSDIIERLPDGARVLVVGCGGCGTREGFGGPRQCRETAAALRAEGVEVTGWACPDAGDDMCDPGVARATLEGVVEQLRAADLILLLACAQAEPAVARVTDVPVVSGVQTIVGGRTGGDAMTVENCDFCDECIAELAGGLCPYAFCPKGLINGPCGGAQAGRCEVLPGRPCVWELIHRRLKAVGRLDVLRAYQPPVSFEVTPDEGSSDR